MLDHFYIAYTYLQQTHRCELRSTKAMRIQRPQRGFWCVIELSEGQRNLKEKCRCEMKRECILVYSSCALVLELQMYYTKCTFINSQILLLFGFIVFIPQYSSGLFLMYVERKPRLYIYQFRKA